MGGRGRRPPIVCCQPQCTSRSHRRCFKLGRGRRSYNEVSLRLTDGSKQRDAAVQQCIHIPLAARGPEPQARVAAGQRAS